MSKEALNQLIEKSLTDRELNADMQRAHRELEETKRKIAERVLGKFDLTADERDAIITKDVHQLIALGVSNKILKLAEWCTGD